MDLSVVEEGTWATVEHVLEGQIFPRIDLSTWDAIDIYEVIEGIIEKRKKNLHHWVGFKPFSAFLNGQTNGNSRRVTSDNVVHYEKHLSAEMTPTLHCVQVCRMAHGPVEGGHKVENLLLSRSGSSHEWLKWDYCARGNFVVGVGNIYYEEVFESTIMPLDKSAFIELLERYKYLERGILVGLYEIHMATVRHYDEQQKKSESDLHDLCKMISRVEVPHFDNYVFYARAKK